jgi:hypothetical protein
MAPSRPGQVAISLDKVTCIATGPIVVADVRNLDVVQDDIGSVRRVLFDVKNGSARYD